MEYRKEELLSEHNRIMTLWSLMYWSIQILTWLILPFFQEYYNSGAFTPKERVRESLYINGLFYGVMLAIGVVVIIYLMIKKGMTLGALPIFIKALSNA